VAVDERADPWYIDKKSGYSSIHVAIIKKNMNIANVLLQHDRNLMQMPTSNSKQSVLHLATETNNASMVRFLIN